VQIKLMESIDGIQIDQIIGVTERGTLWRATRRRKNDRIVRIIDPRFCDHRFRQALTNLSNLQYPRMLRIVGQGWAGVHFYIEYLADSSWETLEDHFNRLHWRMCLQVVDQICEILPQWSNSPVHPLGLNALNIIMVKDFGHFLPWLLPCPSLKYSSPCDLFGINSSIISTIAPEVIRGVTSTERSQDIFALGTLAMQALGCSAVRQVTTDEDRVEAQACGALFVCDMQPADIEDFLFDVGALKLLIQVIKHFSHISPDARPMDAAELRTASRSAFEATKPGILALEYVKQQDSRRALKILEWGFETIGENPTDRILAATICERIEEFSQALKHLDQAVEITPGDLELCWRRCDLRWYLYQKLPPLLAGEPDPEGDLLIKDLNWLKLSEMNPTQKNEPHKRLSTIYRRRHNLPSAAQELFDAIELEAADMEALYLYAQCFKDMKKLDEFTQILHEAYRRLDRMVKTELMSEREAQVWREQFNTL